MAICSLEIRVQATTTINGALMFDLTVLDNQPASISHFISPPEIFSMRAQVAHCYTSLSRGANWFYWVSLQARSIQAQ